MLLHFMEMLNFTLILLASPQLDTSPLEIPQDQSPQGARVGLEIRNSGTARLPGGVSPTIASLRSRTFSLSRWLRERLCYELVCFFCFPGLQSKIVGSAQKKGQRQ